MSIVNVNASKSYDVIIENGIISNTGIHVKSVLQPHKAVIVSDTNVIPIYGDAVTASLTANNIQTLHFIIPAGEESKSFHSYQQLLIFLAENCITKDDVLIALGGGVVGDLTGFTAATYLRGIRYVQIPTSLLAMVDSSVGGKTAIDLPIGKNLVGAFHQPVLVLCDPTTLNTLPDSVFRDGCAEVIKYSILYDEQLFSQLMKYGTAFDRIPVITRCVELKRDVVRADEFDRSERQKLNLGHTLGHGVEKCSNYTVPHGRAVAIGMSIISRASAKLQYCTEDVANRIQQILIKFGLPYHTAFAADDLYEAALSDKKRSADAINLIIPIRIGECNIVTTNISELRTLIEAGL